MKYYSQYGQDKWLYKNLFTNKTNGFFIEVGADDGVDKSNTLFFEETLGWKGICVEPSPTRFNSLIKNRKCLTENVAVSKQKGEAKFLDIQGYGKGLSGIIKTYSDTWKQRIQTDIQHPQNKGFEKVTVPTITFTELLEKNNAPSVIDFCSIDTEGHEYEVVTSLDFTKYTINVFVIELNPETYGNVVNDYLVEKNYTLIQTIGSDSIYQRL